MASKKRQRVTDAVIAPPGLADQASIVEETLVAEAVFDKDVIHTEVDAFYNKLGLPQQYFDDTAPEEVARHITSLQAAKLLAKASGREFDINLHQETENSAMFASRSVVSTSKDKGTVRLVRDSSTGLSPCRSLERYIEDKYLSGGVKTAEETASGTSGLENLYRSDVPKTSLSRGGATDRMDVTFRLQCYRSEASIDESGSHMRLYFLRKPDWVVADPEEGETDVEKLGDRTFVETVTPEFKGYYQAVVSEAAGRLCPAIRVFRSAAGAGSSSSSTDDTNLHLLVGYKTASTHSYFTGISDVYRQYGLFAVEKYVEPFSNGITVLAFTLRALGAKGGDFEHLVQDLIRDCSLHYVLPRTSLTPLLTRGMLSAQEVSYAYASWKFAFHFLSRSGDELHSIASALGPSSLAELSKVRKALRAHAFTEGSILDCMFRNPKVIQELYAHFVALHDPRATAAAKPHDAMLSMLKHELNTELDLQTFTAMLTFNTHIRKTNFFVSVKAALAFRLDPAFLSKRDYPDKPHGLFFVIGSEFRGFHIRFRDVARGGIRVVRSAYAQAFSNNVGSMFEECYNLANTQQRKNKDIPEGGSKGVILLNLAHQDKAEVAFRKYVDSILDVLLTPNPDVKDSLGSEEILFFGPDENTADFMDWAALHARGRGYRFWKAFTTGKSTALGGIPHDVYGMTTHSVRQYALGIQEQLGLAGGDSFKVQTGGPDGDLGSNEILMGNERTTAVVDGSGVLYDPTGINADELRRLARGRLMVSHVDMSKLSSQAALVLLADKDKVLPGGTVVESGLDFRNTFHLHPLCRGDFFIPCGGRPAAVNEDSVNTFVRNADGSLRFKYVVEGANLFFTQGARLSLEDAGVVVFKDASANKGGVTSSSLEVMAALVLNDDEFTMHMTVAPAGEGESKSSEPPAMYQEYVKEVQAIIDDNARLEFLCLWREHKATSMPISKLSDLLSNKITSLSARIEDNKVLWDNAALRSAILHAAVPKTLAALLGGPDAVLARLPDNYKRALFGSRLASRFIYEAGLTTPEFAFFEFVSKAM